MLSAATLAGWQRVVALVQPETILRWHRDGFRSLSGRKSRSSGADRRLAADTVALIRAMATDNRTWGECRFGRVGRAALASVGRFPAAGVSSNLNRLKEVMEAGRVTDTSDALKNKFEHQGSIGPT
jgi:hypothetical protein